MKKILEKLNSFKYPLLLLALGLVLMLLPSTPRAQQPAAQPDLAEALSLAEGVGETCVLISEEGVVVVCDGADDAGVRLKIMEAVRSYTGYGSDRITILKRAGQ